MIGGVQLMFLLLFTMPVALLATSQPSWPRDLQARSYLLGGLCGEGTARACPGPATPNFRNAGAYISPSGRAVLPADAARFRAVPFKQTGKESR
jgi:hypothetical protein